MPRISVIIPTYNRAELVAEAIQSVFDQTYTDWELIVVDDGSIDETAQTVARFGDKRVIYICQEHMGVVSIARNAGFRSSRGEFVSFLDSDDRMLPHNLEILIALLDARPEVDVAYGWYYWTDKIGRPSMSEAPKIEGSIPPQLDIPWPGIALRPSGPTFEGQILPRLICEETMMIGTTLIRRTCVEAIGGFDESCLFQQHWDFFLRVARAGYTYVCCKQAVALLRVHPGNRSRDVDKMLANRLAILDPLFNDSALESTLAGVRQQAYYNAYIHLALDSYTSGNFEQAARCLNGALEYSPLRVDDLARVSEAMTQQALAPETNSPLKFAHDLLGPIRPTAQIRRLRRKVLGQVNFGLAFRHYQTGELNRVWPYALGAVIHDPSWLGNRGLMRIGLEAVIGPRVLDRIRSRRYPLAKELLEMAAETTSIFISPHLDDAALSCGGTLAHLAQRRAEVIMVTVFTADLADEAQLSPLGRQFYQEWGGGSTPYAMRCQEDKAVAEYLGVKYLWLDLLAATSRDSTLKEAAKLHLTSYNPKTDPYLEPVREAILRLINEHPGAIVFAPLGLGRHRDHLLVHQALEEIKRLTSAVNGYYYYEDYPYAANADLQARLKELDWQARPLTIDIADTLDERVRLIKMYTSQVDGLFDDPKRVYEDVEAYATRVGTRGKPRERFWSPQTGTKQRSTGLVR